MTSYKVFNLSYINNIQKLLQSVIVYLNKKDEWALRGNLYTPQNICCPPVTSIPSLTCPPLFFFVFIFISSSFEGLRQFLGGNSVAEHASLIIIPWFIVRRYVTMNGWYNTVKYIKEPTAPYTAQELDSFRRKQNPRHATCISQCRRSRWRQRAKMPSTVVVVYRTADRRADRLHAINRKATRHLMVASFVQTE